MRPLEGRNLWFVGIGGAGMSALALVAHAWGAEVGGSDRERSSYVDRLEAAGVPVTIGHDGANVPEGAEVIVSSAIAPDNPEVTRARVTKRGEFLAELVALTPSIVVAGAHGKTTTTAMIAFVLDRLGARSGVPDRRRDPTARRERARGRGLARGGGRRVGPLARALAPADRGGHQRRPGSPRHVRVRGRGARAVRALARAGARVGTRRGTGAGGAGARSSRRAQPAQRRRGAGGARARRRLARRGGARAAGVHRRRTAFRAARRGARRHGLRRLRPSSARDRGDARGGS